MLFCVEILPRHLPATGNPGYDERLSLQAQAFFGVKTARLERRTLYLLNFEETTSSDALEQASQYAAERLLTDPVAQTYRGGELSQFFAALQKEYAGAILLTAYRPGVTDAEGESTRQGYAVMSQAAEAKLPGLQAARTAQLYYLDLPLTAKPEQLAQFTRLYLINDLVQDFAVLPANLPPNQPSLGSPVAALVGFSQSLFAPQLAGSATARTVPLLNAADADLLRLSKEGLLALNLEEMQAIQSYYRTEQRDPTDIELETLAQTWSEHCVHKTFKALINYTENYAGGTISDTRQIDGIFKSLIADPTHQLKKGWIVSAFVDNAGVISFDKDWDVSFKVETHNHPSALEPFGGANTGLGGVIRDVMAVSAKPIASTDVFCLGDPATLPEKIPADVLPPERIFRGVVDGVRDYGNKMGIPTVNGAILFDRDYLANPLVYCGSVGISPHGSHPRNPQAGDRIVVLGGRTGRDGVHGATFSSIELGGEASANPKASQQSKAASVVQIGNPIEEKKALEVLLKARDAKLYNALTDCGAGGLSSAIGEMGAELGARVELANVPLKYPGLEPWEIWVSEAQERMLLAINPANLPAFMKLCDIEGAEATDLGEFTDDGFLTLLYAGKQVGQLKMEFLHHGLPRRTMSAVWNAPAPRPVMRRAHYEHHRPYRGYLQDLESILADPNVASKEAVIRVYDHEIMGGTVIKPLVGANNDGPGDAAAIQPVPGNNRGIVISNGINPRYGLLDPYHMAACAIDEAVRNAVAIGASLDRMALLDNFSWGNPNLPERLGELVRAALACRDYALAYSLPFISGKDSLNNEFRDPQTGKSTPIPGTLLISALAVVEDITKLVTMDFKGAGNLVYLVGRTRAELGGSYFSKYHNQVEGDVPKVEAGAALRSFKGINRAIRQGLVRACHDLSEGGLAVAAAEMAFSGNLGVRLDLTKVPYNGTKTDRTNAALLFSETPSRFLVEVEPQNRADFEKALGNTTFAAIGAVLDTDEYSVLGLTTATVVRTRVSSLKTAWQTPLFTNKGQA